jgi:hypothetical protein
MKSNKQRRVEIKAHRRERAATLAARLRSPDVRLPKPDFAYALGCEPADRAILQRHNNTYGVLPGRRFTVISIAVPCDVSHAGARGASVCELLHLAPTFCSRRHVACVRWVRQSRALKPGPRSKRHCKANGGACVSWRSRQWGAGAVKKILHGSTRSWRLARREVADTSVGSASPRMLQEAH